MVKDPRSEELQVQHEQQKNEMVKSVAAVLRDKLGWTHPRSMAELIVDNRDIFRQALSL